uniref:Uncharacterized protein n=1 Tax=Anguilla anguilla TaxID=7936 RepID=A0A0E9SD40_ANGAN
MPLFDFLSAAHRIVLTLHYPCFHMLCGSASKC